MGHKRIRVFSLALLLSMLCLAGVASSAFAAPGDSAPDAVSLNGYFNSSYTASLEGSPTGYYYFFKAELWPGQTLKANFTPGSNVRNFKVVLYPLAGANTDYIGFNPTSPSLTPVSFIAPVHGIYQLYVATSGTNDANVGTFTVSPEVESVSTPVSRVSGTNRYATSVAIAKQSYPNWAGVRDVVIASGDSRHLPDALTAAGLAGAYRGPVLLTPMNYTDNDVRAAIQAMPRGVRLHVVGGTPAVSAGVYNKLKALSHVRSIDRIAGSNRYATAQLVALRMKSVLGSLPRVALITSGGDSVLFDALIASTASARNHYPVLLVSGNAVPSQTTAALKTLGLTRRYIIGDASRVSEGVRATLRVAPGDRIAGADVQGDAAAFAERAKAEGWLTGSSVGFAAAVPDAATGGALMGKLNGPMLLVNRDSVPVATSNFLTLHKAGLSSSYIFGGPPAVSEAVRMTIGGLLN